MYSYPVLIVPGVTVITPPRDEPVSLAEMKRHLRVDEDQTEEDEDIESLVQAAREYIEEYTGLALVDQVIEMSWEGYPDWQLFLKRPPLLSVVSFKYTDANGTEQTLATDQYTVDNTFGIVPRIVPSFGSAWPGTRWQPGSLKVRYRAGYVDLTGSPEETMDRVPGPLRSAIKMLAAHLYENRTEVVDGARFERVPVGVQWLCKPYRVEGLGA